MPAEQAKRATVHLLAERKRKGERIVSLTAYDFPTARIEEEAGVDFILVGDSIAMAVMGEESTLTATMDLLVAHSRAVRRGAPSTLVVGDMPFGSYQASDEDAVRNAARFLSEGGMDAVKLEGGSARTLSRARAVIESGIPVMGHVGLLPQSVRAFGGYPVIGSRHRNQLLSEALALEEAGAFALVIESVEEEIAREMTGELSIPTIGIGAGRFTDGQILVVNDMLGLTEGFEPRFLRRYADLHGTIMQAISGYARDVRSGAFPGRENVYGAGRKHR
jgi:3-methyl-2-oxobutanoate hydroxymethyltransferase